MKKILNILIFLLFAVNLQTNMLAKSPNYRIKYYKSKHKQLPHNLEQNSNIENTTNNFLDNMVEFKENEHEYDLETLDEINFVQNLEPKIKEEIESQIKEEINQEAINKILTESQLLVKNTTQINNLEKIKEDKIEEEDIATTQIIPKESRSLFSKIKEHFVNNRNKYILTAVGLSVFALLNRYLLYEDAYSPDVTKKQPDNIDDPSLIKSLLNEIVVLGQFKVKEDNDDTFVRNIIEGDTIEWTKELLLANVKSLIIHINDLKDEANSRPLKIQIINLLPDKLSMLSDDDKSLLTNKDANLENFMDHEIKKYTDKKDSLEKLESTLKKINKEKKI